MSVEARGVIDDMVAMMIGLLILMALWGVVAVGIILRALDVILAEIRMGRETK